MRIILILFAITFFITIGNSAVLDDIYFNAEDAAYKNYGQFNFSKSFYFNPALLADLKNKELNINYVDFYQSSEFDFNSFGFSFGLPLKKINAGLFSQMFMDTTDDNLSYTETRFGAGFSFSLKSLKLGILFNYTMINMEFDSDISIIPGNKYSDSTFNIVPGITYELKNYKLKMGYAYHKTYKQLFGIAYHFSELSAFGISIDKLYDRITIAFTETASIVKNKI